MNRIKRILILSLLTAMMVLNACGKAPNVDSVLNAGADEFKGGKTEEDLALVSSSEILNHLIDEFSGSRSEPEGDDLSEDEAKQIQDSTKDDDTGETGSTDDDSAGTDGEDDTADGSDQTGDPADASDDDTDSSANTIPVVADRDDLKQEIHEMFDNTEEVLNFQCANNYMPDIDEIKSIYLEVEREDPFDAICLARYSYGGYGNTMTLSFEYHIDTETLKQMKEETRTLLAEAEKQIDIEGLSDYEIVCAVNDYLCDLVVYPESEPYAADSHTAYSAFKKGSAVCDGYSRAAKMLLNSFGVECDFVVGDCPGGGHAWNLVKLDGEWYHMDVTWNDGGAEWDENARTAYLLVTDEYMSESRVWDTSLYPATPSEPYR